MASLQVTISTKVTMSVNGTTYTPEGNPTVANVKTQLADADLFCVGGYKGLPMGEIGPNYGLRVRRATTPEEQEPPTVGVKATYGLRAALSDVRVGVTKVQLSSNDNTTGAAKALVTVGVTANIATDDVCKNKKPCKNAAICTDVPFNSFR